MNNKNVKEIPPKVWEFMFVTVTGWKLEYIRGLPESEFRQLAPMILNKFALDCYKGQTG